jgi:hypothetical protein
MKKDDVDFAENLTLPNARSIQSEYWSLIQTTLFICISKMLLLSAWVKTTGALKFGAEVTVEQAESMPFWGTVVSGDGKTAESLYVVEDGGGKKHTVQRHLLRARVWYTVAQAGVTGDKKHDSYATQFFMTRQQQWWKDNFNEPVTSVHIHSDNAGQHFKSGKTLNYLSRLLGLLGINVTWSFGCPGHGKGPWDGFGAVLKRICRREVHDQKVQLKCAADVAKLLKERFEPLAWRDEHGLDSKYTINQVVIDEAGFGDIKRPAVEESFEKIDSIRRSFGYRALRDGVVLQRWFDCWCPACMSVTKPGDGVMDSNYRVPQCDSHKCWQSNATVGALVAGNPFRWWECSAQRDDTRGVHGRRKEAQAAGKKLVDKLKEGSFVAVQDRENQGHTFPFMIGSVANATNGRCVAKVTERQTIDGTLYHAGDYAISVQW